MSENLYKSGTLHFKPVIPLESSVGKKFEEQVEQDVERVQNNANRLLPGKGRMPREAVEYMVKVQLARAQTMQNPYYKFISMVSSFSTEPMSKMWKKQEDVERGMSLISDTTGGVYSAIDAASGDFDGTMLAKSVGNAMNMKSEKEVSDYVKNRRDFITSPEVYGKLFLTPLIYGHILEAKELIQNHAVVQIDIDTFIQSIHATYFARLVSLRMNISRFLGGRYYTLSGNYGRLMQQTTRLLEYFKCRLKRHPNGHKLQKVFPTPANQRHLADNLPYGAGQLAPQLGPHLLPPQRNDYLDRLGHI